MKYAVYAGTRNLYEQMVWAAKSLYANSSVDKIFFLVEDDEYPYKVPNFIEVINVKQIADERFPDSGVNAKTHFTKMALVRVCYTEIFPDVDVILQLDVDTVCIDDVDPIWDRDLTGKWFAACHEKLSGYDPYRSGHYYNVGVCLFNLDQMREDRAQTRLVNWINVTKANCVEQDALNFIGAMNGKATELENRYNENRATGYTDNPAVVHYVGYTDWQTNPNLPRREYLKLYRDKPWKEIIAIHKGRKK